MNTSYNTIFGEEVVPTKYCKACDQNLPITDFRKRGEGANRERLYTICIKCEGELRKKMKKLKNAHNRSKAKYGTCECCGAKDALLHFDHCHDTDRHRGDICEPCNTAIGRLGDKFDGVLNVLKYMLERDLLMKAKNEDPMYDMMVKTTNAYIMIARELVKKIENG